MNFILKNKSSFLSSKFDFNLRLYFYFYAARLMENAGVAQMVRALIHNPEVQFKSAPRYKAHIL